MNPVGNGAMQNKRDTGKTLTERERDKKTTFITNNSENVVN